MTLLRALSARLDSLRLAAPVTDLSLTVEELTSDVGDQPGLHDRAQAQEPLAELLARLQDALGDGVVVRPALRSSWRPEGAWSSVCVPSQDPLLADPVAPQRRYEAVLICPRPTLLCDPPRPIQVRASEERPRAILGRRGWEAASRVDGPERLQGEWWAADRGFNRHYWVVDAGDRLLWIFREGERWYHHGWFD